MYIFAKFVADHIFLQNRDKLNIKNSTYMVASTIASKASVSA
jgi:hypothetical protein